MTILSLNSRFTNIGWQNRWPNWMLLLAALLAVGVHGGKSAAVQPLSGARLHDHVGLIQGRCCKPGRRMGCDPRNFGQTGCVPIIGPGTSCFSSDWKSMKCTSSQCEQASPEDVCEVNARIVGINRCRPTGRRTTIGCPENQWKCHVDMVPYYSSQAWTVPAFVCDGNASTICSYSYSACD